MPAARHRTFVPLVLALLAARPAAAQTADSAAAARAHWRAAGTALRGGDSLAALAAARRAAAAWPVQPAYLGATARLAASLGDLPAAREAFRRLAQLGVTWREDDPALTSLAADAEYLAARDAMRRATAPLARSRPLARLGDTLLHPEAVARDGARRRWLVSSVRRRTILALGDDGAERPFPAPGTPALDAVLGLAVDAERGVLWAASTALPQQGGWTAADSGRSHLVAFDLASGTERRRVAMPAGTAAGDVALAPDGTLFVSDPTGGAILALAPDATAPRRVAGATPLLRSPQGLVPLNGGRRLLVADYAHGLLLVEVARGDVSAVTAPAGASLLGLDGLTALPDGRVAALQNGLAPPRVLALTLDADRRAVTAVEVLDRHLPEASEPTLGALDGRRLVYVANAPWANYGPDGAPRAGAAWPAPLLLELAVP